jgi:hypothetical protein
VFDVVIILVLKKVARVILLCSVAMLRGCVLLPVPIVAGAVRILVLQHAQDIARVCVVCSCDYTFR